MPQSLLRFIIESESKHARINCKWGNEGIEISREVLSGLGDADALRTAGQDLSTQVENALRADSTSPGMVLTGRIHRKEPWIIACIMMCLRYGGLVIRFRSDRDAEDSARID
jgi:hypothetical protein